MTLVRIDMEEFGNSFDAVGSLCVDSVQSGMQINDSASSSSASASASPNPFTGFQIGMKVLLLASVDRASGGEGRIVFEVEVATNGAEIFRQSAFQQMKIVIHGKIAPCPKR